VVKGTIGAPPKTSWVLGYVLLVRIHYLLSAAFDVFGNLSHQLVTRVYMMPQMSLVQIEGHEQEAAYMTILRDNDHTNILSIFSEKQRRRPESDRPTVVSGILGAYPNALFRVEEQQLQLFVTKIAELAHAFRALCRSR